MFLSKIYPWHLNSIHEHIVILQWWAYFKGGPIFERYECDGFHVENEDYSIVHFECIVIVL